MGPGPTVTRTHFLDWLDGQGGRGTTNRKRGDLFKIIQLLVAELETQPISVVFWFSVFLVQIFSQF